MRAFVAACVLFAASAFSLSASAQGSFSSVNVIYGAWIPEMNMTFRLVATVRQEDLDDMDVVGVMFSRYAYRESVYVQSINEQQYLPLAPGVEQRHFLIPPGSPLAPQHVGNWRIDAFLVLMWEGCDYWTDPPNCVPFLAHGCNRVNYGEPCFDQDFGYLD